LRKLLIVDNSKVIINLLKDIFLQKNDFDLFTAKSFEEAKDLLDKHQFFASISNIVLPDALNGEFLELLKKKEIPTVVLTSKIDAAVIKIIKNVNVVDYISKDSIYELEYANRLIKLLTFIQNVEVLVVDDSAVIVSKIKNSLESLLLKVHVANDGLTAIKVLVNNPNISIIITDHNMKEMSGLELIKKVRKSELHSKIPILIMTTENNNDLKINFFKNGATDLLLKPVLEEELKSKIIDIFSNIKQINEIKRFTKVLDEHVITSSTDEYGVITHVSRAFCEISGYKEEELLGKPHNIVRHPDMPISIFKEVWDSLKKGITWKGEIKNLKKDGGYYWVTAIIEPNFDSTNHIIGFTSIREDITDKKRIYELSITDGLTTLYNRRHFNDIAPEIIENSIRDNNVFSFVLLDIDNFKKYNDTYGHQEGDNVLIEVSNALKKTFKRSEDAVFRLGGEEFGILIKTKTKEDVLILAEKARKDIELLNLEHKQNPPLNVLTASFGVSIIEIENNNLELDFIYKETDDALYKAKESGRNKIEIVNL
jgi:diguanylate cyclase (GGDEF)-like protein/PAS domain S-box-containing protein